ncbi:MAG TPA: dTDP-4-dehydrorhamnose reductase [Vicinamibacterales bacterium]|nr:dTDP-4-dehydrorhamnose reductase [Vicinamibacterales bacterium]
MRALVIGASGQVGAALVEALRARGHEAVSTYASRAVPDGFPLDLRDAAAVEHALAYVKPEWVLCPAAMAHVDRCEREPDEAVAVNRDGALHAARMAQRVGARFVYFSTDYVFDGAAGPYAEEDPPRPLSVYGRSKLEGERAILDAVPGAVVVRTSVVYGRDPQERNFVYQVLQSARGARRLRPARDQRSSPTYSRDLAAAVLELCERGLDGLWHLAGAATLDRLAFARLVCETWGLDSDWLVPVTTAELAQPAPRPLRGGLRIDKARRLLRTPLRDQREGLRAMRAEVPGPAAEAPATGPVGGPVG